jgi:hypothetical protein
MSIQPINSALAHLPGEPRAAASRELPGESNAKAKLASIQAAYALLQWAQHRDTDLTCWDDLRSSMDSTSHDILELLQDYDVAEGDCNLDVIDDVVWQYLRNTALSCEVRSSWYAAGSEKPDPDEFRIWLTFGGPSCFVCGDFDRSSVDAKSIRICFSWASQNRELQWSQDAQDALSWFCESLVC